MVAQLVFVIIVIVVLGLAFVLRRAWESRRAKLAQSSPRALAEQLARKLGFEVETVAPWFPAEGPFPADVSLEAVRIKGPLRDRGGSITFTNAKAHAGAKARLEVEGAPAIAFVARREDARASEGDGDEKERLGSIVLATNNLDRLRFAISRHAGLRPALESAFNVYSLESLKVGDGKLIATAPLEKLSPDDFAPLLSLLGELAEAFEVAPLHVRVLGGERLAARSLGGSPRCAYCHDGITGEEPDLVACERCQTVLHDGCWRELGRCPVLGCGGRVVESSRERVVVRDAERPA